MTSCEGVFEYSPYQVKVRPENRNQNKKNLLEIEDKDTGLFTPFKIALISDTHTFYDEFIDVVNILNNQNDIDFVIHIGDLTNSAINREFNWLSDILNEINKPVITIIGNHDYLSNGEFVYKKIFGENNFVFTYHKCKFVIFDDIIWERNIHEPDFDWFNENLKNDNNYIHIIPLSHIPPWDEQFCYGNEFLYNYILSNNNIKLSIQGHIHEFDTIRPYPEMGNIKYLCIEDIGGRGYVILTINENEILIEKVLF